MKTMLDGSHAAQRRGDVHPTDEGAHRVRRQAADRVTRYRDAEPMQSPRKACRCRQPRRRAHPVDDDPSWRASAGPAHWTRAGYEDAVALVGRGSVDDEEACWPATAPVPSDQVWALRRGGRGGFKLATPAAFEMWQTVGRVPATGKGTRARPLPGCAASQRAHTGRRKKRPRNTTQPQFQAPNATDALIRRPLALVEGASVASTLYPDRAAHDSGVPNPRPGSVIMISAPRGHAAPTGRQQRNVLTFRTVLVPMIRSNRPSGASSIAHGRSR